jgi:hypothetical protein
MVFWLSAFPSGDLHEIRIEGRQHRPPAVLVPDKAAPSAVDPIPSSCACAAVSERKRRTETSLCDTAECLEGRVSQRTPRKQVSGGNYRLRKIQQLTLFSQSLRY